MSEVEIKKLSQSQWLLMAVVICLFLAALISLREILMPFAIGALIAYLGDPLVDRLEERGFSRTNGVMIVFGLFLGLLVLVIAVVAPLLFKQLSELAAAIPEAYRWLSSVAVPKLQAWLSLTPINLPELDWRTSLSEHWTSVGKVTGGVVQQVTASSLSLLTGLLNAALVPVVAFYLMRDWDLMMAGIMKLVPRGMVSGVTSAISEAHSVLEAFVRGQLVVMGAQALIYSVGLWLVGLNYAIVLGLVAGAASIIPYAGAVIGVGSALIVGYLQFGLDLWALGLIGSVFIIGQLIESFALTPLLIGDRIGLHPVAVIFALMAGGQLAGFTGILIALPVAAVLLVFCRRLVSIYLTTDTYLGE